jgi:hypothetical protein
MHRGILPSFFGVTLVALAFIWPTLLVIAAAIFFAGWGLYDVMMDFLNAQPPQTSTRR